MHVSFVRSVDDVSEREERQLEEDLQQDQKTLEELETLIDRVQNVLVRDRRWELVDEARYIRHSAGSEEQIRKILARSK